MDLPGMRGAETNTLTLNCHCWLGRAVTRLNEEHDPEAEPQTDHCQVLRDATTPRAKNGTSGITRQKYAEVEADLRLEKCGKSFTSSSRHLTGLCQKEILTLDGQNVWRPLLAIWSGVICQVEWKENVFYLKQLKKWLRRAIGWSGRLPRNPGSHLGTCHQGRNRQLLWSHSLGS